MNPAVTYSGGGFVHAQNLAKASGEQRSKWWSEGVEAGVTKGQHGVLEGLDNPRLMAYAALAAAGTLGATPKMIMANINELPPGERR